MRRLLGLSHSCLLLNPYVIIINDSHFRIICFASLNELLMYLFVVHICRLLAQCFRQVLRYRGAIVERHDIMQVTLQDAEMCWMLGDKCLCRIPDMQAIAKKHGQSRLAYMTAVRVVQIT